MTTTSSPRVRDLSMLSVPALSSSSSSSTPPMLISSPNVASLLKIKILSWSQETGIPFYVRVRIADRTFNLHKHPLTSTSGYFREKLKETNEVELPPNFPGGPEAFEIIALFIYGSSSLVLVNPFNVASLRCAAEFLQMTEEYTTGNLCQHFDIYLNQVVLQSWDDTLIVLRSTTLLLPLAEQLLIVSRCIETLAFMACMEILDPERRRDNDQLVPSLEAALSCKPWSDYQEIVWSQLDNLWIKDLVALPLVFFKRVIGSLRRQGMKEKYVSLLIILFYADHEWMMPSLENEDSEEEYKSKVTILQGIIDLLPPTGVKVLRKLVPPVGFYFSLLWSCVEFGLRNDEYSCVEKLQNQIASMLHWARIEDFTNILQMDHRDSNYSTRRLSILETIFSTFYLSYAESDHSSSSTPLLGNKNHYVVVAELWDTYLNQIATDSNLSCIRFTNLIETVPISSRQTHDHLYRALNTFFLSHHPNLSQEEKGLMCKYLDCHKLSEEVCIEAVQNEVMPLRLIVQALFVQQLNTQQAFKECSDHSFRYTTTNCGEFSGSISSSTRYTNSKFSQTLLGEESPIPYTNNTNGSTEGGGCRTSLINLLLQQKDLSTPRPAEISRNNDEYESTSFRIQNLEKELISLKRSLLQSQQAVSNKEKGFKIKMEPYNSVERSRTSKKRNNNGIRQVKKNSSCIGTVNFASQRKYVNGLLKVLRRLNLFGRGGRSPKTTKQY